MSHELISKKTRQELREHFVNKTLREIEMAFHAADIACDLSYEPPVSGQRRTLVEQYYRTLEFTKWSDARRFVQVYENELVELEAQSASGNPWSDESSRRFKALLRWIEKDGYMRSRGNLSRAVANTQLEEVGSVAERFDAPELQRQIERLRSSLEDDPALALGTAKELLETTCKIILAGTNHAAGEDWDLPKLVKETRDELGLLPVHVSSNVKGVDAIKRLMGSLSTLTQSLAELRNLYGTGHGRDGHVRGVEPRHARLAVGAAATLATFLFETHQNRSERKRAVDPEGKKTTTMLAS